MNIHNFEECTEVVASGTDTKARNVIAAGQVNEWKALLSLFGYIIHLKSHTWFVGITKITSLGVFYVAFCACSWRRDQFVIASW